MLNGAYSCTLCTVDFYCKVFALDAQVCAAVSDIFKCTDIIRFHPFPIYGLSIYNGSNTDYFLGYWISCHRFLSRLSLALWNLPGGYCRTVTLKSYLVFYLSYYSVKSLASAQDNVGGGEAMNCSEQLILFVVSYRLTGDTQSCRIAVGGRAGLPCSRQVVCWKVRSVERTRSDSLI